jgi:uncharacterized GH25 family protein
MKFLNQFKIIAFTATLIIISAIATLAHDYFLLPADFFLKKGANLNVALMVGDEFKDLEERKYQSSITKTFSLRTSKKPVDFLILSTDSVVPVLNYKTTELGLHLVEMSRNYASITLEKDKFLNYLVAEGLLKIQDSLIKSPQLNFTEKYTRYLKTLVSVDKPNGGVYNEKIGHQLEIILDNNPYKLNYGDDLSATILFKDKPLKNTTAELVVKSGDGKTHVTKLNSDLNGKIYFKVNREGTYLVRLVYMQACKDKSADFESWWASYSFAYKLNI